MHCYILNIKAIGFIVSEDFLKIFPIIMYKEANDSPSGYGQVGPQAKGLHDSKHCYILNIYTMGLIDKIFQLFFPIISI